VRAQPLLRRRLIAAALPASRRQLVSRLEAAPYNAFAADDRDASEKYNPALYMPGSFLLRHLYCSRRLHSASTSAARESNQPECIRNISESCELGRVYTFRGKQK
jgi:hypothetical protein